MREDWIEIEIGKACIIGSSKRILKKEYVSEGIPFYRTKEIKELSEGKNISIELFISEEKYNDIKERFAIPQPRDILISAVGTIGISYVIKDEKPFYFKDGNLIWLRRINGFESKYLSLGLTHFVRNKNVLDTSGTAYNALTIEKLNSLKFPLPPLPIQRAIVSKIETLFSDLDNGIADLKKAQEQLKIYRQAVLKKAFEGKLSQNHRLEGLQDYTDDKNDDTREISEINKSVQISDSDRLPQGWKWVNLSNVSEMCLGKMLDKAKNKGELKPYLGNINVRWGAFDLVNLKQMKIEESEQARYRINKNDLIMCEGGEPGRCAIWVSDKQMYIQKALHRVRFLAFNNPVYFYYYFNHLAQTDGLTPYFTDTTIKHLTGRRLKEVTVPLPPIEEQHQIVREIESRLSVCHKVEESINQGLEKVQALRQSILKKAFEGKLLSEAEIEQCKQEADYELASVLLEKIKKEKANGK